MIRFLTHRWHHARTFRPHERFNPLFRGGLFPVPVRAKALLFAALGLFSVQSLIRFRLTELRVANSLTTCAVNRCRVDLTGPRYESVLRAALRVEMRAFEIVTIRLPALSFKASATASIVNIHRAHRDRSFGVTRVRPFPPPARCIRHAVSERDANNSS